MNKNLYLILLIFPMVLMSKVWFVSLGTQCVPASALRACELRDAAFPFDWNITNYEVLFKHWKYGFRSFLKKPLKLRADGEGVTDHYGMEFVHDFPTLLHNHMADEFIVQSKIVPNYLDFYEEVKSKYDRRVQRLLGLCKSNDTIVFIRYQTINREQAQKLCKVIEHRFPKLKFLLVCVTNGAPSDLQFINKKIIMCKLPDLYGDEALQYWRPLLTEKILPVAVALDGRPYRQLRLKDSTPTKSYHTIHSHACC